MKTPFDRALEKAKINIMFNGSIFLTTIAFNLYHKENKEIPTARVDGTTIEYNPDFFLSLSSDLRTSVIIHETWHVALSHILRRGSRDHELYNEAGDYVINQLILDGGLPIENTWLYESSFKGLSTGQIYNLLKKDKDENTLKYSSSGNPLAGDIIEAPKGSAKEIKVKLDNIIMQGHIASEMSNKKQGNLPGEIARYIKELCNPKVPWESLLQQFVADKIKDDYTWTRPNKRYMPEFILPTLHSDSLQSLTFAIDTSGSISDKTLQKILSEIEYIRDLFKPKKLTIIDCDRKINNIHEITEYDNILDLKFKGGGGTACKPVFDYCDKEETNALIYFTDLYMTIPNQDLDYPLLWIVYDNPSPKAGIGEIVFIDI